MIRLRHPIYDSNPRSLRFNPHFQWFIQVRAWHFREEWQSGTGKCLVIPFSFAQWERGAPQKAQGGTKAQKTLFFARHSRMDVGSPPFLRE
jgi:hypothetical protein